VKNVWKTLAVIITASFVLFMTGCANASGGGSSDGGSGSSNGGGSQTGRTTWANNYPSTTVTAAEAAQTIEGLAENKTVILTGSIDSSQLTSIKNAINSRSHNVNLDLSNVTGLTALPNYAFFLCSKLSGIALPNSVTSIGQQAFSGCTRLSTISIPNSVTSIGNYAFNECTSLSTISIPNSVTSIGDNAFYGCSALTQITIPSSVTSIGPYAFMFCHSLAQVFIPASVNSIGNNPFYGCTGLIRINVDNSNSTYKSINGILFNNTETTLIAYPSGKSESEYTIPSSVTSIGEDAFFNCDRLTNVSITSSVTTIGNYAFDSCNRLTQIAIPSSVTYIGQGTFSTCPNLTSITFADTSSTWCYTDNSSNWRNKSGGTPIDVSNPTTNATNFKTDHRDHYWYKQ